MRKAAQLRRESGSEKRTDYLNGKLLWSYRIESSGIICALITKTLRFSQS